eukprot:CAMPEP_0204575616 /NCGR_PEP_ID=MMETSP0661-20131031/41301_1 /ASSEMBLY_ACC=CAM_ASM_000606 /TAXON_ID=109239 /ORGANISM="Alexandrium margalefi, Strain AMGDE01CS-322" /LENGTH=350 /DNA_ID=CAMNT_0051584281 /DNA_START=56 /DNA_END=1108 /DNA_ORIENTATION=+
MAADGAGSTAVVSLDCKVESAALYRCKDTWVRGPPVSCGCSRMCLCVFPCGTSHVNEDSVSAFVEMLPDALWREDWSIPDVWLVITAKNSNDEAKSIRKANKHTFTKHALDLGWHEFLPRVNMAKDGWLTDCGVLWFEASIRGDFHRAQPLKLDMSCSENMWVHRKFTDVVLQAEGGEEFPCHRSVLAGSSKVFDRMFETDCKETQEGQVLLSGSSGDVVHAMLVHIYIGHLQAGVDLIALLDLAHMHELISLKQQCAKKLVTLMNEGSALQTLRALHLHSASCDEVKASFDAAMERLESDHELLLGYARQLEVSPFHGQLASAVLELVVAGNDSLDRILLPAIRNINFE